MLTVSVCDLLARCMLSGWRGVVDCGGHVRSRGPVAAEERCHIASFADPTNARARIRFVAVSYEVGMRAVTAAVQVLPAGPRRGCLIASCAMCRVDVAGNVVLGLAQRSGRNRV